MNRIRKPQHDGLNAQQRVAVLVIGADQSAGPEIASLLAELGYDVPAVATSGAEALHVAATERIDLALLDLQLGGSMSATDTALQMRRQFGIPVIFLSDHGDGAALRTAQTADPYGFIFKPCGKDEVRVAVGLALARTTNDHSLRESEDRFHAMYDFAPDAYFMYDAHGILLDVNRSGENLIGYAKEELIGRSILTNGLLSPEDVPRASDLIGSSKERVLLGPDEFTLIAKDGRRVHTEIRGYPITLNGRRVLLAIARDLTDRRKTEEALRESERRMKVHVESSPIAAIEWDSDLKVTRWNPAAEKIFGYAREDALGRHISFLFAGKVDEATLRPWRQLLTDDAAQQVSTENVTGEGLMISCDWLNTPLVASTGKTTGVVSLVQDVSAKRKAESDIRILSRAVEQSDEVMFITDPSGAITYANAAFEKVYAYRRSDIIGKTPRILKNAEFSPIDYTQLWSTISAGKSFSGQLVNKRRDGSPVVVNASITPLIDDRGDCTGYLAVQSDVTAKCKADDELKRSYSLLHATLQSTADGILVVDGKGQITGFNERFAHLWRIPKHILESHDDGRAMQFVLDQLIDPQAFVAKVQELYARPDQESFDILEFKDGRLFERYSQPQRLDGKAVGRVWSFRDISERNRAERELATERNLLRTLIDSIPDRIYVKDKECKFLVNNRAHLAALGAHSMDQTVGKTDFDFRPEQQAEPYFHDDLKVIHSGQSLYDREEETILPSGEHGWLLTTKVPVRDPGGDILGIVGISRDISSRKRMEEALREGEREFRSLFNNAVLGIYRTTPDGKILAANPAFCRMLGYGSVADMKQLNLEKNGLEEKEARDRFKREMETHGFVRGYESRLRKADGTFISTRENAVVVKNEKGEILYYEGTIEDMTEARLAQEKVARLAHALTSISETVNITDLDGNFLFVNEAFLRAYGYTEDEILGQSVDTIRSPRNPADLSGRILQNTREGGWHGELINIRKDGSEFPVLLSTSALRDQNGEPVAFVGVGTDISERKAAQEALKRYNEELLAAKLMAEEQARQLEIQAIELRSAQQDALKASRLKSEFVATMSHEIRTPMNGVIGMTGLLLDTQLTRDQHEYAEIIRNSAEALLSIINDILDFSKIEAGKTNLEYLNFDLQPVIEETVELLAPRAQQKGVEVSMLVENDVPTTLCGDPGRLRQVLTNLIGNAIKFTEKGEVAVRVQLGDDTLTHATLQFSVTDTGIGIDEATRGYLFQPFTQADGSATRKYGGTGLGLAISRRLVEMMGGSIDVDSTPGVGSTFTFSAVFRKQEVRAIDNVAPAALPGVRILIVDDNQTNRAVLHHLVGSWGMKDDAVDGGEVALDALRIAWERHDPFPVAILDMEMPGMDGEQLARRIKSIPELQDTRLLLLTSRGTHSRRELRQAGFDEILAKPVRKSELYNTLVAILQKASVDAVEPAHVDQAASRSGMLARSVRSLEGVRVLVVEDNTINQKVAVRILERFGCRPDGASDGREAIALIASIPYDIVLMDCQMPEMDGFEATAAIRRMEGSTRHTCIIAMTANALQGDREKCIDAGMDDYIPKPVKPEDLLDVMTNLLQQRKSGTLVNEARNARRPMLDRSALHELEEVGGSGEPGFVASIVRIFLEETPAQIASMRDRAQTRNVQALRTEAHRLRGSCKQIGATSLAELCLAIEDSAKHDPAGPNGAVQLVSQLETEFAAVQQHLQREYSLNDILS